MTRKFYPVLLAILIFIIYGCLDIKDYSLKYDLKENFSGTIEFYNEVISYAETDKELEADKEEVYEYIDKFPELKKKFEKEFGIEDAKIEILDETESKWNISITGKYNNLLMAIPFLYEEGTDFDINKNASVISIRIIPEVPKKSFSGESPLITFYLKYEGKIIKHNAHQFDQEQNQMMWNLYKLSKEGIYFVLETNKYGEIPAK